jgi:hypothetical protein
MKIKVFEFGGGIAEDTVNEFISGKKVIDIKINTVVKPLGSSHDVWYTVVVLYE